MLSSFAIGEFFQVQSTSTKIADKHTSDQTGTVHKYWFDESLIPLSSAFLSNKLCFVHILWSLNWIKILRLLWISHPADTAIRKIDTNVFTEATTSHEKGWT